MNWIARLKQAPEPRTDPLVGMEKEYYQLLTRWWQIDDDPAATDDEARILLARLDELYQGLHRKGCKVPVRLPIEQKAA